MNGKEAEKVKSHGVDLKVMQSADASKNSGSLLSTKKADSQGLVTAEDSTVLRAPAASAPMGVAVTGAAYCPPYVLASQYASIYPSLVSAVVVIIGWIVVNKAQANRERRKQIREYVAGLRSDLDALEKLVIGYHTSEREMPTEREIISRLGRFEKACSSLPRFLNSKSLIKAIKQDQLKVNDEHLQKLRKAMTLNHFADEHSGARSAQDELIQGVELAAEVVQEDLECVRIAALD
jgi:hypothetical protein